MIKRFFFNVRAVLQERGEILIGALGKILADDDDGGTAGAKIFLCARKDHAEFLHVNRA